MTTIGTVTSTGLYQSDSETISAAGSITRRYVNETTDEAAFLAQYSVGTSVYSGLVLSDITIRRAKGFNRYDLKYVTAEELVQIQYGGTGTSKSSDVSSYEEPIEQHPGYDDGQSEAEGVPIVSGKKMEGVTGYLKPATTYSKTTITNSESFSELNLTSGVGDLGTPDGVTGATGTNWLKVGKSITPVGDKYQTVETWQFLPGGWEPLLYP